MSNPSPNAEAASVWRGYSGFLLSFQVLRYSQACDCKVPRWKSPVWRIWWQKAHCTWMEGSCGKSNDNNLFRVKPPHVSNASRSLHVPWSDAWKISLYAQLLREPRARICSSLMAGGVQQAPFARLNCLNLNQFYPSWMAWYLPFNRICVVDHPTESQKLNQFTPNDPRYHRISILFVIICIYNLLNTISFHIYIYMWRYATQCTQIDLYHMIHMQI